MVPLDAARDRWLLLPLGPDVRPAQSHGRFNGGVRTLVRTGEEIAERFREVEG